MDIDINNFLKDCRSRGLTKQTIATYKSNVATFLNFAGDPLKVDIPILRNFLNYLREDMIYTVGKTTKKGVSSSTLNAYFSAISLFYDYLVYEDAIFVLDNIPNAQIYGVHNFTNYVQSKNKKRAPSIKGHCCPELPHSALFPSRYATGQSTSWKPVHL